MSRLYDVVEDPEQLHNRIDENPAIAQLLLDSLAASEAELDQAGADSVEILEQLRALGYIE